MPIPTYKPVYGITEHFDHYDDQSAAKARVKYYNDEGITPDPKSRTKTITFDKVMFFLIAKILSSSDLIENFPEIAEAGNIDTIVGRAARNFAGLTLYYYVGSTYAADYPLTMLFENKKEVQ